VRVTSCPVSGGRLHGTLAVKQLGVSVTDAVAAVTAHLDPSTRGG
jgi:hypothetical protein